MVGAVVMKFIRSKFEMLSIGVIEVLSEFSIAFILDLVIKTIARNISKATFVRCTSFPIKVERTERPVHGRKELELTTSLVKMAIRICMRIVESIEGTIQNDPAYRRVSEI